jgi:chemotaxis protein MotB
MVDIHTPTDETPSAVPESPIGETAPWHFREEDLPFHNRIPKTMHWSIPWSDLMMTMFIFFAVMYIYQSPCRNVLSSRAKEATMDTRMEPGADIAVGKPDGFPETSKESISKIYELSKEAVRANDLGDFASVDLVPDKAVRIVLAADLLFDTGKANLKPEAKGSLERIAYIIRRAPYMVNVVGHTDNVPIHSARFPTNWELSVIRACEVARFLIEEMRIPGKRFYITGHAYHQPVVLNDSTRNRAANRRVEIVVTKERPYANRGTVKNALDSSPLDGIGRSAPNTSPWNAF